MDDGDTLGGSRDLTRRTLLKGGGAALAGLAVMRLAGPAHAFPGSPDDVILPWDDEMQGDGAPGVVDRQLNWAALDSWLTPNEEFFLVRHYGDPPTIDRQSWHLDIGGLVRRPVSLTLADLQARPKRAIDFTLECSGNNGFPWFTGGIGNARWGGTPLAPILRRAGVQDDAVDVVFWGVDAGPSDAYGGWNGDPFTTHHATEHFARSMSVEEAMAPDNLLCYEMNDKPLPHEHGAPVRLIAPGWYGVANVKWLNRIQVIDQRFAGRFMARDYVTIHAETNGTETVWTSFATVSHDRLKSTPAYVSRRGDRYAITGAAWGAPIKAVEVRIDDGPWIPAKVADAPGNPHHASDFSWRFWTLGWGRPAPRQYRITSRAVAADGAIQPAPDDPFYATKATYWESNAQISHLVTIPAGT